jgi:outer membrane protein, adhesin transport system
LADEQIDTVGNQTVEVYLSVLRYRRLLRLSKINVQSHIHTLKQMTTRFEKGAGRKSELFLARARLAQARVNLWTTIGQLRNTMVAYKAVVGEMPRKLVLPRLPRHGLPKTLAEATSMAMRYNPSLMAAKHSLAASEYDVRTARAAFYPNLNLQLLATNNKNVNAVRGRTIIYQGLVIASWNLYRGGADLAALKRSAENRRASEQSLDADQRNVLQQVKEAWNNLQIDKERVKHLHSQVKANIQVFEAYKKEFKIGKRSLLNVLDSENDLFASETEYINARYDVRTDVYSLLSQIGILPYFLRPK